MPKSLMIKPDEVRRSHTIELKPIPANQYHKTMAEEMDSYAREDLIRIERDMAVIRSFETMLHEIKTQNKFGGVEYNHRGPAHLSIGQEASAVGQAFGLGVEDHIYGSHRSHGEILAKSLSAIEKLDDDTLMGIMKGYMDGAILRVIEGDAEGDVKSLAIDFLLYGALAEIFGREAGFNKGMGGSMHAFFTPFGVYPNNAIVGGSADISVGAALFKRVNRKPGLVICNIGDASAGCGPTWEALCFATMDQFQTLWDKSLGGGLPLIMNFVNNFYGMGGQPVGETMGFGTLARMGAGLNEAQMHAERVDGYNPLAVIDAIARKKEILERGDGPVLLDTITYRFSGHSPSDASSYREKAEIEEWRQVDSLITYRQELIKNGVSTPDAIDKMQADIDARIFKAFKKATDLEISPRADLYAVGNLLEKTMYSNGKVETFDADRVPETRLPLADNPRVKQLANKNRSGLGAAGETLSKGRCVTVKDALFEAIVERFYTDPTLIAYGEENRDWGGAFGVYFGLTEALPYNRLFNSPISEAAIVGTAVGYALEGGRPLVELMYCDFLGRAGDEVFNQLAKWQSMSGGLLKMPVVLRVSVGSKYGAQHSQDW
nr:thiamine pyrophosphate-dependent enzyme [Armatimonadota bacterium]